MKGPRALRALRAATALPARSGWVTSAHFDNTKRTRLLSLLDKIAEPKKTELIQRAEWAVVELAMAADGKERKRTELKLADLAKTARALARAWAAFLPTAGHIPLCEAVRGAIPGGDFIARHERFAQAERVMKEDIVYIAHTAERMRAEIRAGSKLRHPAEYLCATKIAGAWRGVTGKAPTLTRNRDAASGQQSTTFQRFVREAVPGIGDATWRQVIEALGSKPHAIHSAKSPKGK